MIKKINIGEGLSIKKLEDVCRPPEYIYVNEFTEESYEKFLKNFNDAHNNPQPVIPIIVDSYGGACYSLNGMVSVILNSEKPVATIVTSKAMSAGAILFGFGTEGYRFIDPYANLMIHDAAVFMGGKVEEIKSKTNNLESINQNMFKRLAKHLNHPENYFLDLVKKNNHADWYLNAKECKKHRLANHIRIPNFNINISLEVTFQ